MESAAPYAAADAEVCLRLVPLLQKKLKDNNSIDIFKDMEMPLIPVLMEMEKTGISLDAEFLKRLSAEVGARLHEIEIEVT